jgi:outer membrane protein assembly factor BamA
VFRLASPIRAALVLVCASFACAQEAGTRAAEIERAREQRATELKPDLQSKPERFMLWFRENRVLERISAGFNGVRVKLGGMVTGSGFAFGPEYSRRDFLDGRLNVLASGQISTRNYRRAEAQLTAPSLAGGRAFASVRGAYHDYRSLNYYGPGGTSKKTGRSAYRYEDGSVDASFGIRPVRPLTVGAATGYLNVDTGPGRTDDFVSSELIYTPAQAPGIDRQTDFARYGAFAEFDYRDSTYPRNGGKYLVQYVRYNDLGLKLHDFGRLEVDLQQYLGFFNRRRVLAFRARTVLTDHSSRDTVPFYLQPVLGGSDELRGFRPFRFTGNHMMVLNGEYRWEAFSGMDMALFADAGKVFQRRGELNFSGLKESAGFGFRFNAKDRVFMRIDVGFSREGYQVWFKFNDVFGPRLLGTAGAQPVY